MVGGVDLRFFRFNAAYPITDAPKGYADALEDDRIADP